jgi:isopentenyl-diphosphate delta-isomerase
MREEKSPGAVILVDREDRQVGTIGKLEAHQQGLLHRAFSIFILNSKGEMLLQQRAAGKYHSGGLWTNACCSHQRPDAGVTPVQEAELRLQEEMGFTTPLRHLGTFTYHADFPNGLQEHELDHVFAGIYDGPVAPHPGEAQDFEWMDVADVEAALLREPERFTAWFAPAFQLFRSRWPGE